MGVVGFVLTRVLTAIVLFVAITVGWVYQHEIPMGRLFATLVPLLDGVMPPEVVGHGHMEGTPPVPDNLRPAPRPVHEIFHPLPGDDDAAAARIPANGLGLCCRATAYDDVLVRRTVLWYLLLGGRHLDGAHLYLNHDAVGRGVRDAVERGVPRSEIFVTTKLFPSHFGYNRTLEMIPKFLDDMKLDYIDMLLLHSPSPPSSWLVGNDCTRNGVDAPTCRQETWKALTELRKQGLVHHVGVSNFAVRHIQDIEAVPGGAPIANNQIQVGPFAPPIIRETMAYCNERNITVTAYSPLGGLLAKDKQMANEALQVVAEAHSVGVPQVLLRWALQKNLIVIPGTGNPEHMKENLAVYDFSLTQAEIRSIDGLSAFASDFKPVMDIASMP